MTKDEHINYWQDEAAKNWETAEYLVKGKQHVMALFMFHLVIEKLLKAIWVRDNVADSPPRTHDLQYLYNETDLSLETNLYDYLAVIRQWNIDSRYPDYRRKIYLIATDNYINQHHRQVNDLRLCLLDKLSNRT